MCIDVVRERLVADTREPVHDRLERSRRGEMQREVNGIQQRDGGAEGVARQRDGLCVPLRHRRLHSGEDCCSRTGGWSIRVSLLAGNLCLTYALTQLAHWRTRCGPRWMC